MFIPMWLVVLMVLFASLGVWSLIFVSSFFTKMIASVWNQMKQDKNKPNNGNPTV